MRNSKITLCLLIISIIILKCNPVYANESVINYNENGNMVFDGSLEYANIKIVLENNSDETWQSGKINLSYHLFDGNNNLLEFDGVRTMLPSNVDPGESIELEGEFLVPNENGDYTIQWDLVEEGVRWFNIPLDAKIKVSRGNAFEIIDYKETISAFSIPTVKKVSLILKNTGSNMWKGNSNINISYHLKDEKGQTIEYDGLRTNLNQDVYPGESVNINANINVPKTKGIYYVEWDIVEENVMWFSKNISENIHTELNVLAIYWFFIILVIVCALLSFILYKSFHYIIKKTRFISYVKKVGNSNIVKKIIENYFVFWFASSLYIKVIIVSSIIVPSFTSNRVYFITILPVIITALSLLLIMSKRIRFILAVSINLLISLLIFSDLIYNQYFNDVLSLGLLSNLGQLSSVKDSIYELIDYKNALLFLDVLIIIIINFKKNRFKSESRKRWVSYSVLSLLLVTMIYGAFSFFNTTKEELFVKKYYNKGLVQEVGLLNYHILDIYDLAKNAFSNVSENDLNTVVNYFNSTNKLIDINNDTYGIAKDKNLILIQSEALQNFVINLKVNNQEITPNLNALIQNSIYFDNIFDQTSQGRTSDAEFLTLTSLYPITTGSVYTTYPTNQYRTLPQILGEKGYYTVSSHAYRGDFWNRNVVHPRFGFNKSYFQDDFEVDDVKGLGLSDESFFNQSLDRLLDLPKPFFSFHISLTNHHPFNISNLEKTLDLRDVKSDILANYLHSVHYADYSLGIFIKGLKEKGLYDDSVIVIYGDHDAGLDTGEIKMLIGDKITPNSLDILYDKIPLIINIPSLQAAFTSERVGGHLDIAPSILHLLGIESDNLFMGTDLFSNDEYFVVYRNGSFITEENVFTKEMCFNTNQMQPIETDRSECSIKIEEAKKRLWISDLINRYDLSNTIIKTRR